MLKSPILFVSTLALVSLSACNGKTHFFGEPSIGISPKPQEAHESTPSITSMPSTPSTPSTTNVTPSDPAKDIAPIKTIGGAICNSRIAFELALDARRSMGKCVDNVASSNPDETSGCTNTAFSLVAKTATALIKKLANGNDLVGVNASGIADITPTSNQSALLDGINLAKAKAGSGDYWYSSTMVDVMTSGAQDFYHDPTIRTNDTKVLIVLSDGSNPNGTKADSVKETADITSHGIIILTLGFGESPAGADLLKAIASDPSYYFQVTDDSSILKHIASIATVLCR